MTCDAVCRRRKQSSCHARRSRREYAKERRLNATVSTDQQNPTMKIKELRAYVGARDAPLAYAPRASHNAGYPMGGFVKNRPAPRMRDVDRIQRWAEKLHCSTDFDTAHTGTIYVTVEAPDGRQIKIRVAKHADAPGEADYTADGVEGTVNGAVAFLKAWAAKHQTPPSSASTLEPSSEGGP